MAGDADLSRFMSLTLRHAPDEAGLTLDQNGWADFAALCAVLAQKFGVAEADVRRVVEQSPKKRFAIEGGRIRAVQGHSVAIDLQLRKATPPPVLFHGTKAESLAAILAEGLSKRERHHVHLSPDRKTAEIVAARRKGKSVILRVDATGMAREGFVFFLSENGVWLTESVPPAFLATLGTEAQA